ncbi:MAG: Lrp/AsnC ligand binding domain-containing protein [Chloroflexi bacterium]|nr:Lrp/AsnC ligand binding domain-containing protein [Chloroflexota bacterium]MCI0769618.1 Lrp/AsnC ligand binding domain-containing protein [Chloroflexota bacterium]
MRSYVLIEATIGKARDVARLLSAISEVTECYLVTGPYDVIALVEGDDASAVGQVVTEKIHSIPGVARTITCLAVQR